VQLETKNVFILNVAVPTHTKTFLRIIIKYKLFIKKE